MAFIDEFIQGFSVGQQHRQRQQQLAQEQEDRKLRMDILRHQMSREKIQEKLQARQANIQALQQQPMTGVPDAELGMAPGGPAFQRRPIQGVQDQESGLNVEEMNVSPFELLQQRMRQRREEALSSPQVIAAQMRQDSNVTPFEEWLKRNPGTPISEWIKANAKPDQSMSEVELALKAAQGDKHAQSALDLLASRRRESVVVKTGTDEGDKLLSPNEAMTLGVPYGTKRSEASGRMPMTAGQRDLATRLTSIEDQLVKAQSEFKPEWVGGILSGGGELMGRMRTMTGKISPQESDFRTRVLRSLSEELNRLSGAAISPAEYERLKNSMPSLGMSAPQFQSAIKVSLEVIKNLKNKYGTSGAGGVEVWEKKDGVAVRTR